MASSSTGCKRRHLSAHQVSVDEVGALQVSHPLTDIQTHAQHHVLGYVACSLLQVVRQAAVVHELKHQTHGRALGAHAIELDQLGV